MEHHPESVPINALVAVEGQSEHNTLLYLLIDTHDRQPRLISSAVTDFFPAVYLNLLPSSIELTGTPLGDGTALVVGGKDLLPKAVPPTALEMTRMIATCRVVLPATMVRLSAGRMGFSQGEQTLMFLAGANSIFYGEQLLTTANPEVTASAFTSPLLSFSSFC